jgi:hypothetical protein
MEEEKIDQNGKIDEDDEVKVFILIFFCLI